MRYYKTLFGKVHRAHRFSKYTFCGKRVRYMCLGRDGKQCEGCWH